MSLWHPWIVAIIFIACFAGCGRKDHAEWPELNKADAVLTDTTTLIGRPVALTIRAHHTPDAKAQPPTLDDGDRIVSRRISETTSTRKDTESSLTVWHYELISYELGRHAVATSGVRIISGETPLALPLPDLFLSVERSVPEGDIETSAPLRDLKTERATLPPSVKKWLWFLFSVALLYAVAAYLIKKYWNPRREAFAAPPPPLPDVEALAALAALKSENLTERGEFEPFFVRVSSILRRYIERRYALHAPEMTTEEFMREAARSPLLAYEHREKATQFLVQCDLVKFARQIPTLSQSGQVFDEAVRFVQQTRSLEEVPKP